MSLPASIQAWMPVAQRAMARCAELAAVSSHPDHIDRAYLTDQHKQVNALAGQWMIEAGLQTQTDPAGNLVGLRDAHKPVLVIGSHLDTVPNAGAFDGILGVLTGIEIAAALQDTPLPFGLEIIGFDPRFMKKVSQETGVHIVAPSGYYVDASHRADMTQLKVSELADEMTTDILEGCDGTNIKCGVIGELGCSWPLTSERFYS